MAVGEFGAQLQPAVQLGRLGERGVRLGDPALGEQGAGDGAVHPGDQRGILGLRGEREGELGGLGGAGVGAHVHVGADDAGVQEQQCVGVVQSAPVQLVDGGFQEVDGVAEFTGEVVGDGPPADGGHPGRQGLPGEVRLGPLEVRVRLLQLAGLQGAFAQPEQRGRLFGAESVRPGLREQGGVLCGRLLGPAVGEGALGSGEAQPQVGGEVGGPAHRQLLEGDPEPAGDVPQRLVGGADPARLQGGDLSAGSASCRWVSPRSLRSCCTRRPMTSGSSRSRIRCYPQLPWCPLPLGSDSP